MLKHIRQSHYAEGKQWGKLFCVLTKKLAPETVKVILILREIQTMPIVAESGINPAWICMDFLGNR